MSLSNSKRLRVSRKHFEARDENNFTWSGKIPGISAMNIFVARDGDMAGSIKDENNELYTPEYIGNNIYSLFQIDESQFLFSCSYL